MTKTQRTLEQLSHKQHATKSIKTAAAWPGTGTACVDGAGWTRTRCAIIVAMPIPPPSHFHDHKAVAAYAEGPRRNVPGYDSLLPMVGIVLAEQAPPQARILVVGAGGGLELEALAQAHAGWQFDGVDPSAPMLELAAQRLGDLNARVKLHHGYVQQAPQGPFDGATCLLTMHFVSPGERLAMSREIHRRLKPGAPLVLAHLSVPGDEAEHHQWMSRYAQFLIASGVGPSQAVAARDKIQAELPVLTPAEDEAILTQAGFQGVQLFYAGFAFRGWIAYA